MGAALSTVTDPLAHQFGLERARRELAAASDVEQLRHLALSLLDLLEGQRQTFEMMIRKGWLPDF